jgi:glutamyl-tRNA synthetase
MTKVVTRYAPSPTGNPHVGNIRTALFAYLYAKSNKGKFLLRIEDTDQARFVPEALEYIEESLAWLGISYDGEKVFQSDRLPKYQEYAETLIKKGSAYRCYCDVGRLEVLRKEQIQKKLPPVYDGKCRNLTAEERKKHEELNEKYVVRFAVPTQGKAIWDDLVRGKIEIDYVTQDDPVILKSDGWPTYHLANIVDDHEMDITDVIRGDEWIPSTPKHIAMYEAFGWPIPRYSHLPTILGSDKSKLSKRHGDTAILEYRDRGYLPDAMVNFLALLGWNDGTEKEIYQVSELIAAFDISRVQKSPAVFDIAKLDWINEQYIRSTDNVKLISLVKSLYPNAKITKLLNFDRILEVEKGRLSKLSDISVGTDYFIKLPKYDANTLIFKKSTKPDTISGLIATTEQLKKIKWEKMQKEDFEELLKKAAIDNELGNGDVFWPVRVALSGLEKSPSPAELLWALGPTEALGRLQCAIKLLS